MKQRAKIVAVVSQKGGTGKTAIDCQLALLRAKGGFRVCVVDMDEDQYSAAKLLVRRQKSNRIPVVPYFIATPNTLKQIITKIVYEYDIIFIESTGKVTTELKYAMALADLVLSPIEAVGDNIDTAPKLEETLHRFVESGVVSKNIPAFFIPNKVPSQQREAINFANKDNKLVQLHEIAQQFKYFKVTKNFIKHRPSIYPKCYDLGKGIFELTGSDVTPKSNEEGEKAIKTACEEIQKLSTEIFESFYD